MSFDLVTLVRQAVLAKGGTETDVDVLGTSEGRNHIENFAAVLVKAGQATRKVFPVTIDYGRTLDQMIAACACGYNNPNIVTANFTISGQGVVQQDIILLEFDHDPESDEVEREMASLGLEPAKIEHATAFGEKYPDMQWERPIVFLGSVWRGDVPCLDCWRGRRGLGLLARDAGWARSCQFAALRKVLPVPAP